MIFVLSVLVFWVRLFSVCLIGDIVNHKRPRSSLTSEQAWEIMREDERRDIPC
jgi:hypothetical protein